MDAKIIGRTDGSSDKSGNVRKFILFVIGEAVLLLFLFMCPRWMGLTFDWVWLRNPESACTVYGTMLIMLLVTGLLPDFGRSFIYSLKQQEEINAVMVKKSLLSVKVALAATVAAQIFELIFAYVGMMEGWIGSVSSWESVLPACMAVFGGNAVYGIIAIIILLPVYARLKLRLISMEVEDIVRIISNAV